MGNFQEKAKQWLLTKGYIEVYRNHTSEKEEFHMMKDNVRVHCHKYKEVEYYLLSVELYLKEEKEVLTLQTGKYHLYDDNTFNKLVRVLKEKKELTTKNK